jgi:hypothetical protein
VTAEIEAARSAAARTDCPHCTSCKYTYRCQIYPGDCGFIRLRRVPKIGTCERCGLVVDEPFRFCIICEERDRLESRGINLAEGQQTLGGFA